jgi:hypothetical protein
VNVSLNGKRLDAKVVPLRAGFLPSEVKSYLDRNKDGYDSYLVKVGGRDFLVLGKAFRNLQAQEALSLDGQRAQVEFLEQEVNTAAEGAKRSLFSLGGLGKALIGAVAGFAGGFGALALFGGTVAATPLWVILGIPAAIGLVVGLALTGTFGAIGGALSRTDDSVSTALSSGPPGTILPHRELPPPGSAQGPVPPPVPGDRPAAPPDGPGGPDRPVPPQVDPDPSK